MPNDVIAVLKDYYIVIMTTVSQDNYLMMMLAGLMGLCMGFSFVSLAEIVYYSALAVKDAVRREKREKRGEIGTVRMGDVEDMD